MLTHLISCILFTNWAAQYCQPFIEGGLDIELRGTTGSTRPPLPLPPHTSPSPQIGEDTAWYSTLLSLSLPAHSITILPPNTIITSKCCFKNLHQQIFAWNMTVCLNRRWSVKEGVIILCNIIKKLFCLFFFVAFLALCWNTTAFKHCQMTLLPSYICKGQCCLLYFIIFFKGQSMMVVSKEGVERAGVEEGGGRPISYDSRIHRSAACIQATCF